MVLLDQSNNGPEALGEASNQLALLAGQTTEVTNVRGNTGDLDSQLKVVIDQEKAGALGIDLSAAHAVLSVAFAGTSVNDFNYKAKSNRSLCRAKPNIGCSLTTSRAGFARNRDGEMVPFSSFAATHWEQGAGILVPLQQHCLGFDEREPTPPAFPRAMQWTRWKSWLRGMDGGYGVAWEGLSYQERLSGSQAILLYAVSILVVFLCLAALYES